MIRRKHLQSRLLVFEGRCMDQVHDGRRTGLHRSGPVQRRRALVTGRRGYFLSNPSQNRCAMVSGALRMAVSSRALCRAGFLLRTRREGYRLLWDSRGNDTDSGVWVLNMTSIPVEVLGPRMGALRNALTMKERKGVLSSRGSDGSFVMV